MAAVATLAIAMSLGVARDDETPSDTPEPSPDVSSVSVEPSVEPIEPILTPVDVGARELGPVDEVLVVDAGHPQASLSGPGSEEAPFSTIQSAIDRAQGMRAEGLGVEVVIRPGVYREALFIGPGGTPEDPLIVTGVGGAVVTGADVWDDWSVEGEGVWAHDWPFDWGEAQDGDQELLSIVGRREMVMVDGARMRQVTDSGELDGGAFLVEEDADRLLLRPPDGVDPSTANVEVAVRPTVITLDGATGVVVDGLQFTNAAVPFNETAVEVFNSADVVFSDNVITNNSWSGLGVATSRNLTLERNAANENGGGGMTIYLTPSLLLSDNDTSNNNWRGERGDYLGWSISGVKMVAQHDTLITGHRSVDNRTRGFWLDYDVSNVVIQDSTFCANATDGLMVEAVSGPVQIIAVEVCDNQRNGVLIVDSIDVSLSDSTVTGNGASAIRFDSEPDGRILDLEPEPFMLPALENFVLLDNVVGGSYQLVLVNFAPERWELAKETLTSDRNRWIPLDHTTAFSVPNAAGDLGLWQLLTGQDANSTFESG